MTFDYVIIQVSPHTIKGEGPPVKAHSLRFKISEFVTILILETSKRVTRGLF